MGLKALSLLENIVFCINAKNYLPALVLTRALLENGAVLYSYSHMIRAAHTKIVKSVVFQKIMRKEINAFLTSKDLEDLLIRYSHGTTLKALIKIRKEWQQTRISKFIKSLSKVDDYSKSSEYYSLLCQIAHPSFASNWVFYQKSYLEGKNEIHSLGNKQDLDFFLVVSSYPLAISCQVLQREIKLLRKIRFIEHQTHV